MVYENDMLKDMYIKAGTIEIMDIESNLFQIF